MKLFNKVLAALNCACFFGIQASFMEASQRGVAPTGVQAQGNSTSQSASPYGSSARLAQSQQSFSYASPEQLSNYFQDIYKKYNEEMDGLNLNFWAVSAMVSGDDSRFNLSTAENAIKSCGDSAFGAVVVLQRAFSVVASCGHSDIPERLLKVLGDIYKIGKLVQVDKRTQCLSMDVLGSTAFAAWKNDKYELITSELEDRNVKSVLDNVKRKLDASFDKSSGYFKRQDPEKPEHILNFLRFAYVRNNPLDDQRSACKLFKDFTDFIQGRKSVQVISDDYFNRLNFSLISLDVDAQSAARSFINFSNAKLEPTFYTEENIRNKSSLDCWLDKVKAIDEISYQSGRLCSQNVSASEIYGVLHSLVELEVEEQTLGNSFGIRGCPTEENIEREIAALDTQIEEIERNIGVLEGFISKTSDRIQSLDTELLKLNALPHEPHFLEKTRDSYRKLREEFRDKANKYHSFVQNRDTINTKIRVGLLEDQAEYQTRLDTLDNNIREMKAQSEDVLSRAVGLVLFDDDPICKDFRIINVEIEKTHKGNLFDTLCALQGTLNCRKSNLTAQHSALVAIQSIPARKNGVQERLQVLVTDLENSVMESARGAVKLDSPAEEASKGSVPPRLATGIGSRSSFTRSMFTPPAGTFVPRLLVSRGSNSTKPEAKAAPTQKQKTNIATGFRRPSGQIEEQNPSGGTTPVAPEVCSTGNGTAFDALLRELNPAGNKTAKVSPQVNTSQSQSPASPSEAVPLFPVEQPAPSPALQSTVESTPPPEAVPLFPVEQPAPQPTVELTPPAAVRPAPLPTVELTPPTAVRPAPLSQVRRQVPEDSADVSLNVASGRRRLSGRRSGSTTSVVPRVLAVSPRSDSSSDESGPFVSPLPSVGVASGHSGKHFDSEYSGEDDPLHTSGALVPPLRLDTISNEDDFDISGPFVPPLGADTTPPAQGKLERLATGFANVGNKVKGVFSKLGKRPPVDSSSGD
ncbi:MAG: hypothetical protein LBQ43_00320 [Holosporales bacterium]|jgi:hypothetical protein|nr:hypothetical protein [Holosporales bacterium]